MDGANPSTSQTSCASRCPASEQSALHSGGWIIRNNERRNTTEVAPPAEHAPVLRSRSHHAAGKRAGASRCFAALLPCARLCRQAQSLQAPRAANLRCGRAFGHLRPAAGAPAAPARGVARRLSCTVRRRRARAPRRGKAPRRPQRLPAQDPDRAGLRARGAQQRPTQPRGPPRGATLPLSSIELTPPARQVETPLDVAQRLSERVGNTVHLKREDMQPVFSFKVRHLAPHRRCAPPTLTLVPAARRVQPHRPAVCRGAGSGRGDGERRESRPRGCAVCAAPGPVCCGMHAPNHARHQGERGAAHGGGGAPGRRHVRRDKRVCARPGSFRGPRLHSPF